MVELTNALTTIPEVGRGVGIGTVTAAVPVMFMVVTATVILALVNRMFSRVS